MTDGDAMRPKAGGAEGGNGVDDSEAATTATEGTRASEAEIMQLRTEVAELKDRWLRERADIENIKRRAVREKQDAIRFGSEALLKDLLPVIDNLHRAVAAAKTGREDDPIVTGVELVLRGFDEVLERHGVKVVAAHGEPFDPTRHEAISHVESDAPANTVIGEHQRGYVLHERLLRPALVTVGKGPRVDDVAKEPRDD
jgi:molecular chaperone GrpE